MKVTHSYGVQINVNIFHELFIHMQAKKATKIGDYDTMHKWKRITV